MSSPNRLMTQQQLWQHYCHQPLSQPLEQLLMQDITPSLSSCAIDKQLPRHDSWWLLGTIGCHLCDDAIDLLRLFNKAYPVVIDYMDITDFDENHLTVFATSIPVILTSQTVLTYPFSLADLQHMYAKTRWPI